MRRMLPLLLVLLLLPLAEARDTPAGRRLNRLAKERSPYLRQHATNPVDWYPWGPAAFAKAKAEDKPIFLSIGYAACHWCHVMEHESFESKAIARLLNRTFVCVKVDREERPDLDSIYMNSVYALGKQGGWPMTVVLTPDAKPFWAGTYLAPAALRSTITNLGARWANDRQAVEAQAARVVAAVQRMSGVPRSVGTRLSDTQIIERARHHLAARYDARFGGYQARKKFPPHAQLLWILEAGGAHATPQELAHARGTLDAMASGGFHDHIGGGFHRYTVDEAWFLPHFEKMLYDNALLIPAYAGMYARTQRPIDRHVAAEALAWLEREMKQPGGGYASSLDADTKGHEGVTYTWTRRELAAALPQAEVAAAMRYFNATDAGNYKDERTHRRTGRNVLYVRLGPAKPNQPDPMESILGLRYGELRKTLLAARAKRPQPGLDNKVITSWNGLLLSAFAHAGRDLADMRYVQRGVALADFLLERSRAEDGTLLRFPRASGPALPGFCEDYAHLGNGLLDISEVSGKESYALAARTLGDQLLRRFEDPKAGGFFATSHHGHETLIARPKHFQDSPIPSDNGAATIFCLRLWALTSDVRFRRAADRALALYRPLLAAPQNAASMTTLLSALRMRGRLERSVGPQEKAPALDVRQGVARVRVYLGNRNPRPGDAIAARVDIDLDSGWHVNANPASDAKLIATSVSAAAGSSELEILSVKYPVATRLRLGSGPFMTRVYHKRFAIELSLRVPRVLDAEAPPALELVFQPCTADTCQERQTVLLPLPLGPQGAKGPSGGR